MPASHQNCSLPVLLFRFFACPLFALACTGAAPVKAVPTAAPIATGPAPGALSDSTLAKSLPLMRGSWKGTVENCSFDWTFSNGRLDGAYWGDKNRKDDYSKLYHFREDKGEIYCFPTAPGSKCGTPDARFVLVESTGSGYTFEVRIRTSEGVNICKLSFQFDGDGMLFGQSYDYADWPDRTVLHRFKKTD